MAIPADRIVADPLASVKFCEAVNRRLPVEFQVDLATFNQRLLNLRRRGEAKGGLPRLVRRDICRPLTQDRCEADWRSIETSCI